MILIIIVFYWLYSLVNVLLKYEVSSAGRLLDFNVACLTLQLYRNSNILEAIIQCKFCKIWLILTPWHIAL